MPDVTMPRLSDSMEEGTIVTWHVSDGAEVKAGQELAEIETDKATRGPSSPCRRRRGSSSRERCRQTVHGTRMTSLARSI